MNLDLFPFLNKCFNNSISKKYRTIAFLSVSIIFNIYAIGIFVYSLFNEQLFNVFAFGLISLLMVINLLLFLKYNHYAIWNYALILLIVFITILRSTPFTSSNFANLIIVIIPLIAYSICDRKNAAIITIFFFLLNLIVFIQKLFLNYYNPESFLISFYIVVLYTLIGGLTMFLSYIGFRKESYYENKIIMEKNTNITNNEIVKKFIHELRTSINNIVAVADFLSETHTEQNQKEYIDTIITSINTILSGTKKLDVFSSAPKKQEIAEKQTFDISQTVQEFLKIYANNKKDKQFYFTFNCSKSISKNLIGIPEKLKQILFNIFETIAANTESYKIDIDISISVKRETDEIVTILVEIHTSSIQVNALDVEFDKNYSRLYNYFSNRSIEIPDEEDKEYEDNYSIILAKNIVNHLSGNIGIYFKDPNIVVFWISLPLWKRADVGIQTGKVIPVQKDDIEKTDKSLKDARILVVEDNHLNQRVLILGLSDHVKNIDLANNGKEAIDMFSNNKYDLILMDLHLPILDGFKATEKIRELESGLNKHIPIIGLSAILMDGIEEQCKNAGLDEYISKPYNISKLKERIQHHINHYSAQKY